MKTRLCFKSVILSLLIGGLYLTAIAAYDFNSAFDAQVHNLRSGEFLLDSTVVYVSDTGTQFRPKIAFDGVNNLIVWFKESSDNYWCDLYACRVTPQGEALDPSGIFIARCFGFYYDPPPVGVTFNGTQYLVVYGSGYIYGSRVSVDGTVMDPGGFQISQSCSCYASTVSSNGDDYFVVWRRNISNDYFIYGSRVTAEGSVLDTAGIQISGDSSSISPSVAFDGDNYFVVWDAFRTVSNIYGARVGVNGVVLDSGIQISSDSVGSDPSVAFDGNNYFVVWSSWHPEAPGNRIYGSRISRSGVLIDTIAIPVSRDPDMYYPAHPSVAFDGTDYFVIWDWWSMYQTRSYLCGARVSTGGVVLDTADLVLRREYFTLEPVLVYNGENYLSVWQGEGGLPSPPWYQWDLGDIYFSRIAPIGAMIDSPGVILSDQGNIQRQPSGAFDGANFLVAWADYHRIDWHDIWATRVSGTGTLLDSSSFCLATGYDSVWSNRRFPDVVFGGDYFLASWTDFDILCYTDRVLMRITVGGVVVDTDGYYLHDSGLNPYITSSAFDGHNFLLVWKNEFYSGNDNVYGNRVTAQGVIVDSIPFTIAQDAYPFSKPALAYDGMNYLAVWEDWRNNRRDISGSLITPQGVVLNPEGIPISTADSIQAKCAVAFDGTNYLVVWEDCRSGSSRDIYASRVTRRGLVLDSTGICVNAGPGDQIQPDVAFDGENFLVVWQDSSSADPGNIKACRMNTNGTVIGTYPVVIQPDLQTEPALIPGSEGRILIVWSGYTRFINHKPANCMRIWGKMYPFTQIDETASGPASVQGLRLEIAPNPVIGKAVIYAVAGRGQSVKSLKIYDNLGRCVRSYALSGQVNAITWDGRDNDGRVLPFGVYFCRLDDGIESIIIKIIKLK